LFALISGLKSQIKTILTGDDRRFDKDKDDDFEPAKAMKRVKN
jgi:hypothetical protein